LRGELLPPPEGPFDLRERLLAHPGRR
jgi:hypothetical protein